MWIADLPFSAQINAGFCVLICFVQIGLSLLPNQLGVLLPLLVTESFGQW